MNNIWYFYKTNFSMKIIGNDIMHEGENLLNKHEMRDGIY